MYLMTIDRHITLGKSKEAEIKRINKELANIRSKFKGQKDLAVVYHVTVIQIVSESILRRQNARWLPEEKVCLQIVVHISTRP